MERKWTDYTTKTTPADNDEVLELSTDEKVQKRLTLGNLSNWILNKVADKVYSKLETNNKTLVTAINELNSKLFFGTFSLGKSYTFNIKNAAILIFIRTNQPVAYTGIITIDQFGYNGSVAAIDVKVENKKVTVTNTDNTLRYCIGIIQ